ncbi:Formyl-coenzyme A transferase [Mycobacteroides abscessus]|nr:Formyl-coenzyme A transferase [Mycobacteroides abscessus]
MGFGKRSAISDFADAAQRDRIEALLAEADVVISGYRPAALTRYGLDSAALRERFPALSVVTLDAWGDGGPWGDRRGFDSLVQSAIGVGELYGQTDNTGAWRPGALPVQALDHATGYGVAAAALALLAPPIADWGRLCASVFGANRASPSGSREEKRRAARVHRCPGERRIVLWDFVFRSTRGVLRRRATDLSFSARAVRERPAELGAMSPMVPVQRLPLRPLLRSVQAGEGLTRCLQLGFERGDLGCLLGACLFDHRIDRG